jgi:hypothetical protein
MKNEINTLRAWIEGDYVPIFIVPGTCSTTFYQAWFPSDHF